MQLICKMWQCKMIRKREKENTHTTNKQTQMRNFKNNTFSCLLFDFVFPFKSPVMFTTSSSISQIIVFYLIQFHKSLFIHIQSKHRLKLHHIIRDVQSSVRFTFNLRFLNVYYNICL